MYSISSLLSLHAANVSEPTAVAAIEDAGNRLRSMMVLYDRLYRSERFNDIAVGEYLPHLVEEIVANFPNSGQVRIENSCDDFVLSADKLQPVGIIVNELLTNAMKYAFVGRTDGAIRVSATLKGNLVSIELKDNGVGIVESVDFENSTGFGFLLIRGLAQQLNGRVRFERGGGTRAILEFEK